MTECSRKTCWPDVGCSLGHLDLSKCPALNADRKEKKDEEEPTKAVAMPWSGSVLGLTDLGFVAGRNKPNVLAIVGAHQAGKTTLLGAWYLLLGKGSRADDGLRFAGSRSLSGWEVVANSLRWEPGSIPPAFPPHTTSINTRIPGLLHLAFRDDHDHRRDYVMTDAPGEWFQKWAIKREAPGTEGARWAAEHADAFLLVADREALAGKERGAARSGIQLLARRLAHELAGRPVALVWTKADVSIANEMKEAVRNAVLRVIPEAVEFEVSIKSESKGSENEKGFLDLLAWVLNVRRPTAELPELARDTVDPVFRFGAR